MTEDNHAARGSRHWTRPFRTSALLLLLVATISLAAEWVGAGAMAAALVIIVALVALPVGLVLLLLLVGHAAASCFTRRERAASARIALVFASWLVFFFGLFLIPFASWEVRAVAFARAGEKAAPLIAAIEAHEADRGTPPKDLAALVPDWIDAIPTTSLLGSPEFAYDQAASRPSYDSSIPTLPPTWTLTIHCSRGILNWDVFVFYPDGRYEGVGDRWGGTHELIGDWAYVHE